MGQVLEQLAIAVYGAVEDVRRNSELRRFPRAKVDAAIAEEQRRVRVEVRWQFEILPRRGTIEGYGVEGLHQLRDAGLPVESERGLRSVSKDGQPHLGGSPAPQKRREGCYSALLVGRCLAERGIPENRHTTRPAANPRTSTGSMKIGDDECDLSVYFLGHDDPAPRGSDDDLEVALETHVMPLRSDRNVAATGRLVEFYEIPEWVLTDARSQLRRHHLDP